MGEVTASANLLTKSSLVAPENPILRRRGSDLRSAALFCHNQISKDLWGKKKHANSFVDHLKPAEVQAFALDISLRTFWELQRQQDEYAQCSLSIQSISQLRQITLAVLRQYQISLTREYIFEIPDPEIVQQREIEKQQQIEASREQRKLRAEIAKKERAERAARVKAKRLAQEQEKNSKNSDKEEDSISKDITATEKPEKIVQKSKNINPIIISAPSTGKTNDKSFSGFSNEKKTFKIQPPRKRSANESVGKGDSIATFAALKRGEKKTFQISPASGQSPTLSESPLSADNSPTQNRALLVGKKKEKTFKRPLLVKKESDTPLEEEPIPNITIKQTLVNTGELVPLLYNAVVENMHRLQSSSNEESPLDFYHLSVKGPRPMNEDEYTVVEHVNEFIGLDKDGDRISFFGVYDGHCGKYTSLFIRSQIHYKVCRHSSFPNEIEDAIKDSVMEIDGLVNEVQARDDFACGSTALSVWVRNNEELIVANVGDCRGFISRGGKPIEISEPHHPSRPDEKARIESSGGAIVKRGVWRVNGVLAVSRSVGDNNMKKFVIADPEITRFKIKSEDEFVVIASDGLWDVMKPEESIQMIEETCKNMGRKFVCQALCDAALSRESKDNVTVVVMFFKKSGETE